MITAMATTGINKAVQGSDIVVQVTLRNGDCEPIIIDDVTEIVIFVYQRRESILYGCTLTGGTIFTVDSATGLIAFAVPALATENINTDRLYIELQITQPNIYAAGGEALTKRTDIPLADLLNTVR